LAFNLLEYEIQHHGQLNVTLGGILGGVIGYFFKRTGKKWADLWGGAIGCGGAFLAAGCCLLTLGVLSAMS